MIASKHTKWTISLKGLLSFLISNKFIDIKKGTPQYTGSVQWVKQFKNKNYKNLRNQKKKNKMIGFAKQPTNRLKFYRKIT